MFLYFIIEIKAPKNIITIKENHKLNNVINECKKSIDLELNTTRKMRQVLGSKIRINKLQRLLHLIAIKENYNLDNVINECKRI